MRRYGMAVVLVAPLSVLAGCVLGTPSPAAPPTATPTTPPTPTKRPTYTGGLSSCNHFRNVIADAGAGVLTNYELRAKLQEVYGSAKTAEPEIAEGARRSLAELTTFLSTPIDYTGLRDDVQRRAKEQGAMAGFYEGVTAMVDACIQHGYLQRN